MSDSWDKHFIEVMLPAISSKSKDPRTKVGAVITGPHHEVRVTAFNGFPIGVQDLDERYNVRETKYKYMAHADGNAVCFAARNGTAVEGCTMYLPWYPCSHCAKYIIQAGIIKVVIDARDFEKKEEHWKAWKEDIDIAKTMLSESGVEIVKYTGD